MDMQIELKKDKRLICKFTPATARRNRTDNDRAMLFARRSTLTGEETVPETTCV